jgi:hypothetical protein
MRKVRDTDGRNLTHVELTEWRVRGVTAVQNGESPEMGYSPELNADEWVWRNLKSRVMGKLQHLTKQSMKREAVSHLRRMQKQPDIIKSFFHSETTCPF